MENRAKKTSQTALLTWEEVQLITKPLYDTGILAQQQAMDAAQAEHAVSSLPQIKN